MDNESIEASDEKKGQVKDTDSISTISTAQDIEIYKTGEDGDEIVFEVHEYQGEDENLGFNFIEMVGEGEDIFDEGMMDYIGQEFGEEGGTTFTEYRGEVMQGEYEDEEIEAEGEEMEGETTTTYDESQSGKDSALRAIKSKAYKRRSSAHQKGMGRLRTGTLYDTQISGDFKMRRPSSFERASSFTSVLSVAEEEEESFVEEHIEKEVINREEYIDEYKKLIAEKIINKRKNGLLNRKIVEHYKKRKIEFVFSEVDASLLDSVQEKYYRKLDALSDTREIEDRENKAISAEIGDMKSQRDEILSELTHIFTKFQNLERDTGTGLIDTKTGKEIPEKVVDRLVRRQNEKAAEIASFRLNFIRIRDQVSKKETEMHKLDKIGNNLHLIDYEQLRMENQSYVDKIEERDEELTKLRVKCSAAIQTLAHIREKSNATEFDIIEYEDRFREVCSTLTESRERLNNLKFKRDTTRTEIAKLKKECGLLTKTSLLIDMDKSISKTKSREEQLEEMKVKFQKNKDNLKCLREIIERMPYAESKLKSKFTVSKGNSQKGQKIYRGRPTLIVPFIPFKNLDLAS